MFDNKGEDVSPHVETAFSFIEHGKHHGNVLVHCIRGVSRSASFVIGYLMKKNEMTLNEALSYLQSRRPVVQPNDAFLAQLHRYELSLIAQREEDALMVAKFSGPLRASDVVNMGVSIGPSFLAPSIIPAMSIPPTSPLEAPLITNESVGVSTINQSTVPIPAGVEVSTTSSEDCDNSVIVVVDSEDDVKKRSANIDEEGDGRKRQKCHG